MSGRAETSQPEPTLPFGVWLLTEPAGCIHQAGRAIAPPELRQRAARVFASGRSVVERTRRGEVAVRSPLDEPVAADTAPVGLVFVELGGPVGVRTLERLGRQLDADAYLVTVSRSPMDRAGGLVDLPGLTVAAAQRARLRYLQHIVAVPQVSGEPTCDCMAHVDVLVFGHPGREERSR
jgi:hypothetical protein